jgi:tetratricopeptide (TPR) repeat protein
MLMRSLAIDPLSRIAQQLLGTALERQGRFGEARRQYEALIELYPDFTNAKVALGTLLIAQGKLDEAALLLDDAALIAEDPLAGFLLANCYANVGMKQEMRATLESIVAPPTAAAIAQFALLQRSTDQPAVRELIERELAATNEPIWHAARLMLAVREEDAAAAEVALAAMAVDPLAGDGALDRSFAVDALLIGDALRLTGKTDRANRMVEQLLRRYETSPNEYVPNDVRLVRAFALASLGNTDAALDELARATEQGYRTLVDFEYFLRPEDYPFMRDVVEDARYLALVATIEAQGARMRDEIVTRRRSLKSDGN